MTAEQLKASILQMAIEGKLVPSVQYGQGAEELYAQIIEDVYDGKTRKKYSPIGEAERPFELPEGWKWIHLGELLRGIEAGKSYKCEEVPPKEGECGLVKVSAVSWGIFKEEESKTCYSNSLWNEQYAIHVNDFLISRANTSELVGGCVIVNQLTKRLMLSDKVLRLKFSDKVDRFYLLWAMRSPLVRSQFAETATGTSDSMKNISQDAIRNLIIPLPPLEIQHRIVVRLNEILPIIEEYGKAHSALKNAEEALPDQLRASLLQEAIQGKLVPQLDDEPAVDMAGEEPDEVPFAIPEKWKWVKLGDIVICRDGERVPVASAERVNRQKIYNYYGATGPIDKIDSYLFDERLLLVGEDGANLLSKTKPNAFFAEGKYWVNNHAHVLDAKPKELLDFIAVYINAISLAPYVTGTAQPKFTQKKLLGLPIPLPPLAEQRRIVARLEELLPHVDAIAGLR